MQTISNKNNFMYLCISLILMLFSASVMVELPNEVGEDIFSSMTILMLLASIKSIKMDIAWRRLIYGWILFFIILTILSRFFEHKIYIYIVLLILFVFFLGAFILSAKQIVFVNNIDSNQIVGSLTLYLLLGLIWTTIYLMILVANPESFSGIDSGDWKQIFSQVAYYSFVTLTTLGYGDILPQSHIAEFFVYMEAVVGVFYMAIIVASLVNNHKGISNPDRYR
jgi:hypothetical protein